MIAGRVIRILDETTLVIDKGSQQGVREGMRFAVFTPEAEIRDPDSEELLGTYREQKATLRLKSIHPKFSVLVSRIVRREIPEEIVEEPALPLLSTYRRRRSTSARFERVNEELPIDEDEAQSLPGGNLIHVGDPVEEIPES